MTTKPVVYDPLVPPKMKRRRIRKADVRWILTQGVPLSEEEVKTFWGEHRRGKRGTPRKEEINVIYLDQPHRIYVISVHPRLTDAEQARRKKRGEL